MPTPEFSFIITARNEGQALQYTLDYLRKLKEPIEIILVDDASEVPIRTQKDLRGVKHCRLDDRHGVPRAANIGATMATGNYLVFIDAHVCFNDFFIPRLRTAFKNQYRAIFGCATYMLEDLDVFEKVARDKILDLDAHEHVREKRFGWSFTAEHLPRSAPLSRKQKMMYEVPYVANCMLAVPRGIFQFLNGYDTDFIGFGSAQDAEICARAWTREISVVMLPDIICWHYNQLDRSRDMTSDPNPLATLDWLKYSGSTINELRVVAGYFPDAMISSALDNIDKRCRDEGVPLLDRKWLKQSIAARHQSMPFYGDSYKQRVGLRLTNQLENRDG